MIYFDDLRIQLLFCTSNFDSIYEIAKWYPIDIVLFESGQLGFWIGHDITLIPREHRYICSFCIDHDDMPFNEIRLYLMGLFDSFLKKESTKLLIMPKERVFL